MKLLAVFVLTSIVSANIYSQSYTSYFTGDTANTDVQPEFGLCLMGGAGENDEAMGWWLEKANGGDVVVIRASGSDGYNDYMYNQLGVDVNSVESIVFNSAEAASDPYVVQQVSNAEAIWMAGGDQYDYIQYWQGTAIEDAINELLNEVGGAVGGISAGMAVLGQGYFSAMNGTTMSDDALEDPFAPQMTIGYNDFLEAPFMENVVTETHFNDPNRIRYGRIMAFMARMGFNEGIRPLGMASNEYCAIAIEENGQARAFGEFPDFDDDYIYFLQPNCNEIETPETIQEGQPLTWNRNNQAVKVYKIPATISGTNYFDVTTFNDGLGGTWEDWYVIDGELSMVGNADNPDCFLGLPEATENGILLYPNPATHQLILDLQKHNRGRYQLFDSSGKLIQSGSLQKGPNTVNLQEHTKGLLTIRLFGDGYNFASTFVKTY
jgi:cyanophycinase-like exopeptidase